VFELVQTNMFNRTNYESTERMSVNEALVLKSQTERATFIESTFRKLDQSVVVPPNSATCSRTSSGKSGISREVLAEGTSFLNALGRFHNYSLGTSSNSHAKSLTQQGLRGCMRGTS
jgi:hypothetical protein